MRLLAFFASALLLPRIAVPQDVPEPDWPLDTAGWTVAPSPQQGQVIYVSKAVPNDTNNGLYPTQGAGIQGPKRTIAAGYTALAALTGPPGRQLLLRAGDTFNEPQDVIANWQLSGTSTIDPMVFGSYGTGARPLISVTGNSDAFDSNVASGVRYLLITGIQFACALPASANNQLKGIKIIGGSPTSVNAFVRVEDCYVNGWWQGIVIDPFPGDSCYTFSIRRCVVVDNFRFITGTPPGPVLNCTGVYAEQADNLLVEECVLDRNGWDGVNYSTRHGQNHNIYIQDNCTNVTVKGNISARGSGDNFQLRPIGTIHKNLSLKSPIHFSMGGDLDPAVPDPPRTGDILGNVALEGDDIDPARSLLLGRAYEIKNVEPPTGTTATMRYNIAANKDITLGPNGGAPLGIYLNGGTDSGSQLGIRALEVHDNRVYDWGAPLEVITAPSPPGPFGPGLVSVVLHTNDIQDHQPAAVAAYAFKGPGSHAVTGWTSYGNRFWTGKTGMTFMTWVGSDFTVAGWWQRSDVFDGPEVASGLPQSIAQDVMTLPVGQRYLDPSRTIKTYHEAVALLQPGTGSLDGFMTLCRQQRKGSWNSQLTGLAAVRYFQDGFNMPNPLP